MLTKTQERTLKVLQRMMKLCEDDKDNAEILSEELEEMLDFLLGCDFFGTEGQEDPRGDGREGEWSMAQVQGVD